VLPVTLESARVRLDVPTRADTAAITDACQDPDIIRWTTIPTPYREQDARTFVDALVGPGWASDREYTWAIRRSGSSWLEGIIGYRTAGRDLGFWLAPSARGAGLMHDAVELVVERAFAAGRLLGVLRGQHGVGRGRPQRRVLVHRRRARPDPRTRRRTDDRLDRPAPGRRCARIGPPVARRSVTQRSVARSRMTPRSRR